MRLRSLATILAVLATCGAARGQATFPPETDNAALCYWSALADVCELPNDDATQHLFGAVVTGQMAWDEAKLGPILDSNLDAIRSMQRATKLPECNWGFDYRHGAWMPAWFGMRVKLLSHLNQLQGKREMARGNSQTAVDTWLAGIHFAQDVSRNGTVIVALIAQWMVLENLQALRDSALQGKLNEKQKTELSAAVKAMPEDGFDWAAAWGVEFLRLEITSTKNRGRHPRRRLLTRFARTRNTWWRRRRRCVILRTRQSLKSMIWNPDFASSLKWNGSRF